MDRRGQKLEDHLKARSVTAVPPPFQPPMLRKRNFVGMMKYSWRSL
jgi:hypothetical protein